MDTAASGRAFGQLFQHLASESADFVGEIIRTAKQHLDADVSFLAEFRGDRKIIRRGLGIEDGRSFPLESTYCRLVLTGQVVVTDARNDARVKDLPITAELDIGSYIGVPVRLPDGRIFGTLCCIRHEPDPTIRQRDVKFLQVLADLVGGRLGREQAAKADLEAKVGRIRAVLDGTQLQMAFQPILDLRTDTLAGVEALARFDGSPARSPDLWFADAWEVGLGIELELLAVRTALAQLPTLPPAAYMSINASPETLQSAAFLAALTEMPPARIVVEITEHAFVKSYEMLVPAVAAMRNLGVRVAVDDFGVGHSGLHHMLRVAPQMVKLDKVLTRGLDHDAAKRAMAAATVYFAARTSMAVVAEGIETREEADTLRALDVPYGQGFYFARPGPLPVAAARG